MSGVSGFPCNNLSVGIEQSGKSGGDALGHSGSASGALGGDVSDNTSIGTITVNS